MTFQLRHAVLAAAGQGGPSGDDHGNVKPPERAPAPALAALFARAGKAPGRPPLERWNPPFGGDIDITIDADGTWSYLGSPIRRPELVRLFASVLVREGGAYFLLTPAEKLRISVADVPFIAVELARDEAAARPALVVRTNVGHVIELGGTHPLRFAGGPGDAGLVPYVTVHRGLEARFTRALAYELVGLGEVRTVGGVPIFGIASGDAFFAIARLNELKEGA